MTKTFDRNVMMGGGPKKDMQPEEPAVKYFARGHRDGYTRNGYKFSAKAEPFPGEPTAEQKSDPYIVWYHADQGEAGRQVRVWAKNTNCLADKDNERRLADQKIRDDIKQQTQRNSF
jgi:hypothetical protein